MSDDDATIRVPRHPSSEFFELLERKCNLFSGQFNLTRDEVVAGRMTPAQRLEHLDRLWESGVLIPAELLPLSKKFC